MSKKNLIKQEILNWWLSDVPYTYFGHFTFKKEPNPDTVKEKIRELYRGLSILNKDRIGGVFVIVFRGYNKLKSHRTHVHGLFLSDKKPSIYFPGRKGNEKELRNGLWKFGDVVQFERIMSPKGSKIYLFRNLYEDENNDPHDIFTSPFQDVKVNDFDWYDLKLLKKKSLKSRS